MLTFFSYSEVDVIQILAMRGLYLDKKSFYCVSHVLHPKILTITPRQPIDKIGVS